MGRDVDVGILLERRVGDSIKLVAGGISGSIAETAAPDGISERSGHGVRNGFQQVDDGGLRFGIHAVQVEPLHNIRVRPLCHVGVVLQRGIHGLLQLFRGRAFQIGQDAIKGIAVRFSNGVELERFDPDLKVGDLSVVAIGQRLDLTIELVLVDCAGVELEP